MYAQVKNTFNALPIVIISDDLEFASQVAKQANLGAYSTLLASSVDDRLRFMKHYRPQVIIACDEGVSTLHWLQEVVSTSEITVRPILICVSDNPSSDLFAIADQVIPISFLSHIEPIITNLISRFQTTFLLEKQTAELEADNHQLNHELAIAKHKNAEINLLKEAIVHGVSHELRTPMLQVKSAVALLNEDETINRTIMDLAMEATTRLEGGIRNVTLLNELMNESSDIQVFSVVPVVQIVQAAIRNLGRSWEHKNEVGRIEIVTTDNPHPVVCDKQQITIAIQLLLDNALKFSQDKVIVEVVDYSNKVAVSIRDRGIGIAEDQLAHIFEPFYQIDGSSTRRFGGMGIGLAIVRLILNHHSSSIQIDSNTGTGSVFWFELDSGDTIGHPNQPLSQVSAM